MSVDGTMRFSGNYSNSWGAYSYCMISNDSLNYDVCLLAGGCNILVIVLF